MPNINRVFPPLQPLLLVMFLACVGMIWMKSLSAIAMPDDTNYPESAIVQTARLAVQSGRLYPALDAPPYTPAPYGPFFYLLLAAVGRICKGDIVAIRLLLRSIVFASYVALGPVGYLLARGAGTSRNAAALGTAAIWAVPQVLFWSVSVRPDFPGLLLCLSGVWVILRRASTAPGAVILSGVCCAGAILFKQSFIAAPAAIAVFFVLRRAFRDLAVFAASGLIAGLSVAGYLMLRGEPVISEMLLIGHSPMDVHSGTDILYSTLSVGLAVLVMAGGVAGCLSALGPASRWQLRLLACYFLLALIVAALTLLQVGSNANYLFEMWTVASVLSASVLPQAQALWTTLSKPIRMGAAAGFVLLATQSMLEIRHPATRAQYSYDRLRDLHVLSTDPSLTIRGRDPELLDPFLSTILEYHHVWAPLGILGEIGREEFDVVFAAQFNRKPYEYHGQPQLSLAVLHSLAASYQPLCRTPAMLVMTPKNRPSRFSSADASYTLRESCEPESSAPLP